MPNDPTVDLFTIRECANEVGLSAERIRQLVRCGELRVGRHTVGGRQLIERPEVERLIAKMTSKAHDRIGTRSR